ncbi:MAG: signal peptidase II [Desulfobacca sp.]|uniref:signal peptidase II n=1 Tax=Desulfobacca sp. TaxID=2067990 RepID=UPI004049C382
MTQPVSQSSGFPAAAGKYRLLGVVLVLGVALDQLSKWWVIQALPPQTIVPVIPDFFNLVHVYNKGAAFGLLSTWPAAGVRLFFVVINLIILAVLGYLYQRTPREYPLFLWSYSLVLSGAVGNLIDRLRWGEVLDFLDFYVGRHHWPAFNVADSLICVGAGLLILAMWRSEAEN